ncbi:probable G-protein coupled receptor B0563.6 isoform X3 [Drosophila hydei]|uniref:Probable G-protein coupled receptor B0563.6 isoform X3 n=1 Tax=Drosophila hydei TaxID=7224 RepID=A0A6J2SVE1_DROHY|nr:probable G-protein coupled receptor B0563.6 isoform X3 [Drosophila hydei]
MEKIFKNRQSKTMITRLYNTEEDPAYCSVIWGANLTSSNDLVLDTTTATNATHIFANDLRDDLYVDVEDPRTEALREYCYGIILPIICALGIIGNVLNLIVLTRRNMRGTAYIYMRAYSTAALLAIVFAIPFGIRMLVHKDRGQWEEFGPAFYTAHLELFLGNGCLGVGVMMLLVLTIERYVSVCHPGFTRPVMGPPGMVVFITCCATFIIYLPSIFRGELIKCMMTTNNVYVYLRRDNNIYQRSIFYSVYKIMLEVIFKLIPTVLIAGLNMRIMLVYRRTCERRRQMVLSRATYVKDDDPRKFAEERRLFLLLGSTSILFLLCVSPMAILHMTIASEVLPSFPFQVFRALANLLELINYSMTFYIYCLFSEDFRNTLMRTFKWPWLKGKLCHQVDETLARL